MKRDKTKLNIIRVKIWWEFTDTYQVFLDVPKKPCSATLFVFHFPLKLQLQILIL